MNEEQSDIRPKTILMLGCFDSKGEDFQYLYDCLLEQGVAVITLNTGVMGSSAQFPVTITAESIAEETDWSIEALRETKDRGVVIEKMGEGAAKIIADLLAKQKFDAAIGMGGGGGTYIALSAMQAIPIGIPKLCLSTIATKDLSRQVGAKDILLMPSVVDVAGLNKISQTLIRQAAGAIVGMTLVSKVTKWKNSVGTIAVSMFGNTTTCVEICSSLLRERGYEVLAFHAVGVGGKTMESLVRDGFFDAVLDITTTELADDLCDGICSAGPDRLTAAAQVGIPQVVVPGCLDMVNYGHLDTVPTRYKSRQLYSWAPDVTLMRTNEAENRTLGDSMAQKLNKSKGEVAILLPLRGISKVSSEEGVFYAPSVDQVLFSTIKERIDPSIPVFEIDAHINDELFAREAVRILLEMLNG